MKQSLDATLVQVAGGENLYIRPAGAIKPLASPQAVGQNVAAIETYAAWLTAKRNDFVDSRANIVGIHQKGRLFREDVEKITEGFDFIVMGHDPRVGLCSINRD